MKRKNNKYSPKNAAERSAQHLANLLGVEISGFLPSPDDAQSKDSHKLSVTPVNLDTKLYIFKDTNFAALVIISAVIKDIGGLRKEIISSIKPEYFGSKNFIFYIYAKILADLTSFENVSISKIEASINNYGKEIWGRDLSPRSLRGKYYTWAQIISINPEPEQVKRALDLILIDAKNKNLI